MGRYGDSRSDEEAEAFLAAIHGDEAPDMDPDGAIRDYGVIRSSFSGRTWGVSVDRINGQEVVSVTELEIPSREASGAPLAREEQHTPRGRSGAS